MPVIYDQYLKLNNGGRLTTNELNLLLEDTAIKDFQLFPILTDLVSGNEIITGEKFFIEAAKKKFPTVEKYLNMLESILGIRQSENSIDEEYDFLFNLYWKKKLKSEELKLLIDKVCDQTIEKNFLSLALTLVKKKGISSIDLAELTRLMTESGETYDYRNNSELGNRKIIRRYPTGALSEKIALIMPSLLMAFSKDLPLCSPFLVAKSLSYTGGTYDKLKSIIGFEFPAQGEPTIELLKSCAVSMTVSDENLNPADRFLYQFRSITNTVESTDLIVSSIASKQMAIPADSLLLDIRFGPGAFLDNHSDALQIGKKIATILSKKNIKTSKIITGTSEPTGCCIGNYWEVIEAIALMNNSDSIFGYHFDPRGLKEQLNLVVKMTLNLLHLEFPDLNMHKLSKNARTYFQDGTVLRCFFKLLEAHGVSKILIENIKENKSWLDNPIVENDIRATSTGKLASINQKQIGLFVNFELGGGMNDFTGVINRYSGMILTKKINDAVNIGETIAKVMHCTNLLPELLSDKKYFTIEPA